MSFLKDLAGIQSKATISHFSVLGVTLDCVVEETVVATNTISDSAVESGARVADHKVRNAREGVIRGIVVNYEVADSFSQLAPGLSGALGKLSLPSKISGITNQAIATVNRYAGKAKKIINTAKRAAGVINKVRGMNSLKDIATLLNDDSATDDRITRVKNTLEQIAYLEDFVTITTSLGVYNKISLTGVTVTRQNNGSAEFQISFKEFLTYDVEMVQGIDAKIKAKVEEKKPIAAKKAARPAAQAAKPLSKGATVPQKSNQSAARTIAKSLGIGKM